MEVHDRATNDGEPETVLSALPSADGWPSGVGSLSVVMISGVPPGAVCGTAVWLLRTGYVPSPLQIVFAMQRSLHFLWHFMLHTRHANASFNHICVMTDKNEI